MQTLTTKFVVVAFLGAQFGVMLQATPPSELKSGLVTLDAKPEPIAIDPARTAVIVVDMENDFAAKGGMFDRAGADISGAQQAIAPTANVLTAARHDDIYDPTYTDMLLAIDKYALAGGGCPILELNGGISPGDEIADRITLIERIEEVADFSGLPNKWALDLGDRDFS